jgi:hypothetical protein
MGLSLYKMLSYVAKNVGATGRSPLQAISDIGCFANIRCGFGNALLGSRMRIFGQVTNLFNLL